MIQKILCGECHHATVIPELAVWSGYTGATTVDLSSSFTANSFFFTFLPLSLPLKTDIIDGVDAWSSKFIRYYNDYFANVSSFLPDHPVAPEALNARLAQFLFSPRGGRYRERFSFVGEVGCGRAAPEMLLAEVTFTHRVSRGGRGEGLYVPQRSVQTYFWF